MTLWNDTQRIDWLEEILAEVEVTFSQLPRGGVEIKVGRVALEPGLTLREAMDRAMGAAV